MTFIDKTIIKKIQKNTAIIISVLGFVLLSFGLSFGEEILGEEIELTVQEDIFSKLSISGLNFNQTNIRFRYGGNNFGGLFFIKNIETLNNPEYVRVGSDIQICSKKINGIYYNNQRGMRFWPLDPASLNVLKSIDASYGSLQIAGGLFTDCQSTPSNRVLGNIRHSVGGYNYDLIAGIMLDFHKNTYFNFGIEEDLLKAGQNLFIYNNNSGIFLSGYVLDSYGGIGVVLGNSSCIDLRPVDPKNVCSGEIFIQQSNCGNNKTDVGTKNCSGIITGTFCKYNDEQYLFKGAFVDTVHHRGLPFVEVMRKSCLHRGKGNYKGEWTYFPDDKITIAEVLKTLVKIRGIAFNDFHIESEDKEYPFEIAFADLNKNYRFSRYANYAYNVGLTDGLYTIKNNKKYINPEKHINRYDAIKKIMETFNIIYGSTVEIDGQSKLTDIQSSNPYYNYIRQAESLGIIEGFKQADGTYKFGGERAISRAEFAKIVSIPFNLLLMGY